MGVYWIRLMESSYVLRVEDVSWPRKTSDKTVINGNVINFPGVTAPVAVAA